MWSRLKGKAKPKTKPLIATVTCDVSEESVVVVVVDLAVQVDVEAAGHTVLAMLRGVVESYERDGRAVLGRQVQRGSRQEDAPARLDGDPLEHQSQSGDGEELGSLLDDLENAIWQSRPAKSYSLGSDA